MVRYNNYWYNKFVLHKEITCKNLEIIAFYERTTEKRDEIQIERKIGL